MSRKDAVKTGLILCAMILTAAVFLNVKHIISLAAGNIPDMKKYHAGDAEIEDPVKNLDIDWTSGKINIEYHKSNTVTIHEESGKTISPDRQLRWFLDKDTLRIRYEKPGIRLFSFSNQKKNLTITFPENTIFNDVSFDVTSGDVNLPLHGKAENVSVSATSGNIVIDGEDAENLRTEATSGDIQILMNQVSTCKADTTSGDIQASLNKAGTVKAEATSGNITLSASALNKLDIDATSGNIQATLPKGPGFTARLSTTSGSVKYDLPLEKEKNTYVCGDGSGDVKIETTSGNITILPWQE